MSDWTEALRERLARLGIHFEDEMLARVEALVRSRCDHHEALSDLTLLTISAEAHRRPELDLPAWV